MFLNLCLFSFFVIFNSFAMETDFDYSHLIDADLFLEDDILNAIGSPEQNFSQNIILPNEITNESNALIYLIKLKKKLINEEEQLFMCEVSEETTKNFNRQCDNIISNIMVQRFGWSQSKVDVFNNDGKKVLQDLYSKKIIIDEFIAEFDTGKLNPLMVAAANDAKNSFIKLLKFYKSYLQNLPEHSEKYAKILHNLNIRQVNIDGYDARVFAAILNSKNVMSIILDIDQDFINDSTVLYHAIRHDSIDIFRQIHEKYPIDACYILNLKNSLIPEIHLAAHYGACKIINYLLDKQVSPNFWSYYKDTPLHFAAVNNQKEATQILIARGGNVNSSNSIGITPLMAGAVAGSIDALAVLIENKVDLNAITLNARTALMFAAGNFIESPQGIIKGPATTAAQREKICELLEQSGASTNIQDKDGLTALMHAITDCNKDIISRLFVCSDLNIRNKLGKSSIDMFYNYLGVVQ